MLKISPKERICVGIDYFSRKVWAKAFTSKESHKIVKFIKELHKEFPFKTMFTDNGLEFCNHEMKVWTEALGVEHRLAVPYYHKSNGRVERVNRTLRTANKKTKGCVKRILSKIINNYNNLYHRGIGMAPNEAIKTENWDSVRRVNFKYKKEFDRKNMKGIEFVIGEKVVIRNEKLKNKMDNEFEEFGIIERFEGNGV
jgi:transposase InsO family protein